MSRATKQVAVEPIADRVMDGWRATTWMVLVALSFATVRHLGQGALGWANLTLLIVTSLVAMARSVPDRWVPEPARTVVSVIGIGTGIGLIITAPDSIAPALVFLITGHLGYRYAFDKALTLAVLASVGAAVALAIASAYGQHSWQWYFGLFTGTPAFIGMARRNRQEVLRNAQLALQQNRRAAASEAREHALAERARIARDIHDVLAHSLSGVHMQLELAGALFEAHQDDQARAALGAAQTMVRDGLTEARRAVAALREDALPLPATLQAILDPGAEFDLIGEQRPLPTEIGQTLVRVGQEAITNVRRHAPGAAVRMTLEYGAGFVALAVRNEAAPPSQNRDGSGMGLVGMRERAALVGASVTAGPTPEGGWLIQVRVAT